MLTVLLTSLRVAPGLLSWQAWSALRSASRVLAGSADHPQLPALTAAGVIVEVIAVPQDAESLVTVLRAMVGDAGAPVVWLAPPGEDVELGLLSTIPDPPQLLHGSYDVPGAHLLDAVRIMDTLRASCPWDTRQTHESLLPYLLEEAYEAVETVETGDLTALREELGDVLLQVLFHARIAAERPGAHGGFTIDDVADTLAAKLIRRHPHVFGSVSVSSAEDVTANWEEIKKAERAEQAVASDSDAPSVLDGVAFGQPALSLAAQLRRRAVRVGFPSPPGGAADDSASPAEGFGDQLMRAVAHACDAGIDPEMAVRAAARRYAERVRGWERARAQESS